jgi:hypothetical protein
MYAKILIGELCVDEDFLTIKPKKMGGMCLLYFYVSLGVLFEIV